MELSYDDVLEILRIIDASDCQELHLEIADFKLVVKRHGAGAAVAADAAGPEGEEPVGPPAASADAPGKPGGLAAEDPPAQAGAGTGPPPLFDAAMAARDGLHAVTAPMVGTFYWASAPGAPPFVEVGRRVEPQDTVGILEVMKLFTDIRADCQGRVVAICAENAQRVQPGQTLILIEPER